MSWLSDFGSSVAGAVTGGLINSAFGNYAMERQYDMNVDAYKHRYQWQVADLRAAGLNPVLAATNLGAGSVAGTGLAAGGFAGDVNSAMTNNRRISEIEKKQVGIAQQNADSASRNAKTQERSLDLDSAFRLADYKLQSAKAQYDWRMTLKNYLLSERKNAADIANSTKVADAQAGYYSNAGAAALIQAEAAASNAATGRYKAEIDADLAESQKLTNSALQYKYETERAESEQRQRIHSWEEDPLTQDWRRVGNALHSLNPLAGFLR